MKQNIIVIGAGPAGLITAYELSKQGYKPLVLEARNRIGGRASTIHRNGVTIEQGAEFIHGNLPITKTLLGLAGITFTRTGGKWVQLKSGVAAEDEEGEHWTLFMQKLKGLKVDMPLQDFLEQYFPGTEYTTLKDRAIAFAEGYDSADASRASAKALYEEWSGEEEEQYRVDGGYSQLMEYLANECKKAQVEILLSHPVSGIVLEYDQVKVLTNDKTLTADKVVIALPLGILQNDAISIAPLLPAYSSALSDLGFGDVIKFVLQFSQPFWEEAYPGLGFLMSGAAVPTWWTQAPTQSNILTGWMAGRIARAHAHMSEQDLQALAITALSGIFSKPKDEIGTMLQEAFIINWSNEIYTRGSYAYTTVGTAGAQQVLSQPLEGRLYFAGEYMYNGPQMGTVEAAFWSGTETARHILKGE